MKGGTRKRGKSWSYYFDTAAIGGNRKKIEKGGFRTKKEAEAALAKALAEYNDSGCVFKPSEISVSDYLDFWFAEYCKFNLSDKTQYTYSSIIRNHLKPQFGAYRLNSLQAAAIQKYINQMKTENYAMSTIQVALAVLTSSLDYAVEPLHYIRDNPCRYVKIGNASKPPRERIILTKEQFDKILELFPFGSRFYIPLMLGWNCGLRINECMGLTWNDIDFENRTISIDRQLTWYRIPGRTLWYMKSPKYDSKRVIPFGETLFRALKAEKKRQLENEMYYGEFYTVQYLKEYTDRAGAHLTYVEQSQKGALCRESRLPLVCQFDNGRMLKETNFRLCAKKIQNILGIDFEYHCLRRTHATKLVEADVGAKAVQYRLGHKRITTTLKFYVSHTDNMAQDAADKFEAAVNGGLPPR